MIMTDAVNILHYDGEGEFVTANGDAVHVTRPDVDFVSIKASVTPTLLVKLIPVDGFHFSSTRRENLFRDDRLRLQPDDWVFLGVGTSNLHLFIREDDAEKLVSYANGISAHCMIVRPSKKDQSKTVTPIASTSASYLSQNDLIDVFVKADIKILLCCGFNQKSAEPSFIALLDEICSSEPDCQENVFSVGFDFYPPGSENCLTLVKCVTKASEIYPLQLCGDWGSFTVNRSINRRTVKINVYCKLRHWHVSVAPRLNRFKGLPEFPSDYMNQVSELANVVNKMSDVVPHVAQGFRIEFSGVICSNASYAIGFAKPLLPDIVSRVAYQFHTYADYRFAATHALGMLTDPIYQGSKLKTRIPRQLTTGSLGLLSAFKILVGLTDRKPRGRFKSKGKNAAWHQSVGRVLRKVQQLTESGVIPSQTEVLDSFDADHRAQARSTPVVFAEDEYLNQQRFIQWVQIRRHPKSGLQNPWFLQSEGRVYGAPGFGGFARNKKLRQNNECFNTENHLTARELRRLLLEAYSKAVQLGLRNTWHDVLDLRESAWDENAELPTVTATIEEFLEADDQPGAAAGESNDNLPDVSYSTPVSKRRRIDHPETADVSTRCSDQLDTLGAASIESSDVDPVLRQYRQFANIFFSYWALDPDLASKGDEAMMKALNSSNKYWSEIRKSKDDRITSMPGFSELSSFAERSVYDWFKRSRNAPSDTELRVWISEFRSSGFISIAVIQQVQTELQENELTPTIEVNASPDLGPVGDVDFLEENPTEANEASDSVDECSLQSADQTIAQASPVQNTDVAIPKQVPSLSEDTRRGLTACLERINRMIATYKDRRHRWLSAICFESVVDLTTAVTPAGPCSNIADFRVKIFFQAVQGYKQTAIFRGRWALWMRSLTPGQRLELKLSDSDETSCNVQINYNCYDASRFYTITTVTVVGEARDQSFTVSADRSLVSGSEDFLLSWICDTPRDWMPLSSMIDCHVYKYISRGSSHLPLLKLCGIVIGTPGRPVGLYKRNDGGHFLSTQLSVVDSSYKTVSARVLRQAAFSCKEISQFSFQHYSQGDSVYDLKWPVVGQLVIASQVHVESKLVKDKAVYFNIWVESHREFQTSLHLYDGNHAPACFAYLARWGRELISTANLVDPLSQFAIIDSYGKAGMDIVVMYKAHRGTTLDVDDSYRKYQVDLHQCGTQANGDMPIRSGPLRDRSIEWVLSHIRPDCWLLLTRTRMVGRRICVNASNIIEMPDWSLDVKERSARMEL